MKHWLVKTEPEVYSIDDLKRDRGTCWDGVRNYQARNTLREMKVGDQVLVYHSSCEPSGIAGLGKVKRVAYADPTQFDPSSDYYDPKATPEAPRWFAPDIAFVEKYGRFLPLSALREERKLAGFPLFQRGSRLSVLPVSAAEFQVITALARGDR